MVDTPETITPTTFLESFPSSEPAMTKVHVPKLKAGERAKLPEDVVQAADTLTEDVLKNSTAG